VIRAVVITAEARQAIIVFVQAHERSANRCPALKGEGARTSALAWARALAEGMKDGTFVELDGKPCLEDVPPRAAAAVLAARQEALL
jgi:hypothetical protein